MTACKAMQKLSHEKRASALSLQQSMELNEPRLTLGLNDMHPAAKEAT